MHSPPSSTSKKPQDLFLVCGLQSLGQHCVAVLKEYDVKVNAIDDVQPEHWEVPEVPSLLEKLIVGDCRQPTILEQAGIGECRSILLVTRNERINIEAAFAARRLNPHVRLIVRSDKQNFNKLLSENLGNFVAFEPTHLSAHAFALASLGSEAIGYFTLEGQLLQVIKHQVQANDSWCKGKPVHRLNLTTRRILSHITVSSDPLKELFEWNPEAEVQVGDTLVYIDVAYELALSEQHTNKSYRHWQWQEFFQGIKAKNLKQKIVQFWQSYYQSQNQIRRIATIYGITVIILWFVGIILYRLYYPDITLQEAFYATAVLLLGGYGDLFGGVEFRSQSEPSDHIPWWLRFFSLGLTLTGQAFVGVLYALVTDALVTSRFQFFNSRPPIPQRNHVVIIGLNRLGQKVAALLQELNQPLVGIHTTTLDQDTLPDMPLIIGNTSEALAKVNLSRAKSIVLLGDDNMENLEIGLMAHAMNPATSLIIRSQDRHFSDNIAPLFPYAQVLCGAALSAEVFACAAFGENVLSLFHLSEQIVMVTEYKIEEGDTLNGLLLSEIASGYSVVPILYHKYRRDNYSLMPWYDVKLYAGDRLIVLATSTSLQRIEWGEMLPRQWSVQIEKALTTNAVMYGAEEIVLITGCSLATARQWMNNLPGVLPIPLYKHQAQRLVRALTKIQVLANVIFIGGQVTGM
ncbi:MAG: potassium channel family protein [Nostoc sp. DedVER02]|uniref:potassium channel family protein n=1 Tax=unclassified Nostoc TaxID=2593658 RepID=UPI002AD1D166|nr:MULTISPECIES: NAD-binding protein [unclassified Nostoc]MDZ7986057.1 NAD-binding protein [Nostoc sp. DedVER02]MDZ8114265.1 NAD-binding protein [Nostoc sp. DedVER01b]